MTRFSLVTTFFLSLFSVSLAFAGDMPPTAPGNPTATVYSPTSAGLRWQRATDDHGPILYYSISRDGTNLGEVDALSFIDRALRPGRGYNYAVVAIDSAGQRSARSVVRVETPDLPPSPPENVRHTLYSQTAAAVVWDRSPVFGQRYEVRRDGVTVDTTRGTSHVDSTLLPGRRYLFEIISVNRQDQRSRSVRVFVDTRESGSEPTAGPSAPSGLRADVYSQTAAEIFWNRPSTAGLSYEISRDGELRDRTNGTSFFDDTLLAGQSYTYEVVAFASDGARSSGASIMIATPEAPAEPPPTDNPYAEPDPDARNVVARLGSAGARDLADDLVSNSYLTLYYNIDPALSRLMLSAEEIGVVSTLECPGGGNVSGIATTPLSFEAEFDDCVVDDHVLSGGLKREMVVTVFGAGGSQESTVTFDEFSVDAGNRERLSLSGTSIRRDRSVANPMCDGAPTIRHAVENQIDSARVDTAGDTLLVGRSSWTQSTELAPRSVGEPYLSECESVYTLGFRGETFVESIRFGRQGASFMKAGSIIRDPRDAETSSANASLTADFRDRSMLTVTATSDEAGEAQVDIVVYDVAVSFIDDYRFEAREDVPPILGN